jgi:acetyltransferase
LIGYEGSLSFVNPNHREIAGHACYPSLADVPGEIDVIAINTRAALVNDVVSQGLERDVDAFVVHAGDFAEAGVEGAQRQQQLQAICRGRDVMLVGPNCLGIASIARRACVLGSSLPDKVRPGPVAIISQSGSVVSTLLDATIEIGVHLVASTGNEAVTTTEDLLAGLLDAGDVPVVVLFVESIRQPERFRSLAGRALRDGVALIVMKVGLTERGGTVSRTHTGAIATNGEAHRAFFRQLGVVLVEDFDELSATIALFARTRSTGVRARTGVLGTSGGKLAATADAATDLGLTLPALSPETLRRLSTTLNLPPSASIDNPVDVGTGFRSSVPYGERFAGCLAAVADDPDIDLVVVQQDLSCETSSEMDFNREIVMAALGIHPQLPVPLVVASSAHGGVDPQLDAALKAADVPVLQGTRATVVALSRLDDYRRARSAPAPGPALAGRRAGRLRHDLPSRNQIVESRAAADLLRRYGLPLVESTIVTDIETADLSALPYPVVVKVNSADIVHKTEAGGVRLAVRTPDEARVAARGILASVQKYAPHARIDGIEIAPHLSGFSELLLGSFTDAGLGPVVVVGLGGEYAEALRSVAMLVPPFSHEDAEDALTRFAGHEILRGLRGHPGADIGAIAGHLRQLGDLALDGREWIDSIDVNPFIVGPGHLGGVAVDLTIVTKT